MSRLTSRDGDGVTSAASGSRSTGDVGQRAWRRVAWRLLPFAFLIYIVNYIDRVNVSFANLRMSTDLGFSDRVYGLGVGMFYVSYVLFEIPGALIVERWSARKWIARIMISWGFVTVLTGFVQTAGQFYAARFFLGLAEASFFPGMIIYLTHWFRLGERSRAIACLYAAVPTASLLGSPVAGWLLGVDWMSLPGWRWLFILEGIPAVVLGVVTLFYLTDWPAQARWLPPDEREWLVGQLRAEQDAKRKVRDYTIADAVSDRRVLGLTAAWFLALAGSLGTIYWLPTFVKRLSGLPDRAVTSLLMVPAVLGIAGILFNAWHSDRTGERRVHAALPLAAAGVLYALATLLRTDVPVAIGMLLLGSGVFYALFPVFWSMPTMILSASAAAAAFGLINSIGQMAGLAGPYIIGVLIERAHSVAPGLALIACVYLAAAALLMMLRIPDPSIEPRE
jgi:MFS transporter, ACS family, tartrate transporter